MGFLSKIFGEKQSRKSNPDLAFYEEIVDYIVISDTLKSDLKANLKQAFQDPKAFYDDNKNFILSERGLKYPQDALLTPKFVLVDTLLENGQMAEVDWKEPESEIRIYLNEIRIAKRYDFTLSEDDFYRAHDTGEIINLIDKQELKPQGFSIELLDINSDSYVFTIIPLDKEQKVKMMFEKLK
ncbi:hypothetical protein AHMF7605_02120 [Adhaeribacter arboris]|uniref:DUF6630 domain-containing protein n=1 Tax=Adhaeribacter arboris TaxID=2072846 RepID=A0A2T2YA69_9BACT|nr:DUF6630 family protein [Adhaeribacter arboris]PSR52404.1 hypothetical protein AHMF7605_02120 [Adhaeribacter arboris]